MLGRSRQCASPRRGRPATIAASLRDRRRRTRRTDADLLARFLRAPAAGRPQPGNWRGGATTCCYTYAADFLTPHGRLERLPGDPPRFDVQAVSPRPAVPQDRFSCPTGAGARLRPPAAPGDRRLRAGHRRRRQHAAGVARVRPARLPAARDPVRLLADGHQQRRHADDPRQEAENRGRADRQGLRPARAQAAPLQRQDRLHLRGFRDTLAAWGIIPARWR